MRTWIRLAVMLAACVCLAACQRGPDLSRLGSPAHRLAGHWASSKGHEEYFAPLDAAGGGDLTVVHPVGEPSRFRYGVIGEDMRTQTVHIVLMNENGDVDDASEQAIAISEDGESATVTYAQDATTIALARVDAAATPAQSRYVIPPAPATTAPARKRVTEARGTSTPPGRPAFGPPVGAPDGQYRYVLIGYDGMTPKYAWKRVAGVDGRNVNAVPVTYSRGIAQRHNYAIWLHAVAFAILLITTLLFRKEVGARAVLAGWGAVILLGLLGVFVLHAAIIAGILEIIVGFVLLVRGLFPQSDMLN